jgi:plastocyanin
MKSKPFGVLFGLLALVAILGVAPAFGQTANQISITVGAGASANAACVTASNCFAPNPLTVAPGTEVDWKNPDTTSHTVTSGKVSDNDAGSLFDSGLVKKGAQFKFTFANAGTYNYFCTVHPWMAGQVIVAAGTSSGTTGGAMTMVQAMSADASTKVSVDTTPSAPTSGQPLTLAFTFTNVNGDKIHHQNYAITVTQGGTTVLDNQNGHTHTGDDTQTTTTLKSSDPVEIHITLNGVGLPTADPTTWTGPKGELINFHVVPEFGPVASIVLAIAVLSMVVFAAKTRVIPRL